MTDFGFLQDGDLEVIGAPLDFLGVNYYFPSRVRAAEPQEADPARRRLTTSASRTSSSPARS